jgi:hypothetical protein
VREKILCVIAAIKRKFVLTQPKSHALSQLKIQPRKAVAAAFGGSGSTGKDKGCLGSSTYSCFSGCEIRGENLARSTDLEDEPAV